MIAFIIAFLGIALFISLLSMAILILKIIFEPRASITEEIDELTNLTLNYIHDKEHNHEEN